LFVAFYFKVPFFVLKSMKFFLNHENFWFFSKIYGAKWSEPESEFLTSWSRSRIFWQAGAGAEPHKNGPAPQHCLQACRPLMQLVCYLCMWSEINDYLFSLFILFKLFFWLFSYSTTIRHLLHLLHFYILCSTYEDNKKRKVCLIFGVEEKTHSGSPITRVFQPIQHLPIQMVHLNKFGRTWIWHHGKKLFFA
jgi:hypothetical protein